LQSLVKVLGNVLLGRIRFNDWHRYAFLSAMGMALLSVLRFAIAVIFLTPFTM
jgi:hypothetical protein